MPEMILAVNHWTWWIAGVVLVILEMFLPSTYFLWLGVAALLVGLVVLLVPDLGLDYQLLIFAALAVCSVVAGRVWLRRRPIQTDIPTLNRRGSQYLGREFTLHEAIVNGVGKLHVDDTFWKAMGPDLPEGSRVRVTGLDGTVLKVEAVSEATPPHT